MLSQASYDALLPYRSGPKEVPPEGLSDREYELAQEKYIEPANTTYRRIYEIPAFLVSRYKITPKGEDALLEFEEARDAQSKAEAAKKSEHRFQILLAVSSAILGSLLTLLIEHSDMIIDVLFPLFQ